MSSRVLAISRERRIVEQHAGALGLAAPDPAAQLVQLGEAEALGLLDHHDRGGRHVDADLDHRGGDQHREPPVGEVGHHRGPSRPPAAGRAPGRPGRRTPGAAPRRAPRRRRGRRSPTPRPAGRSRTPARRRRRPCCSRSTISPTRVIGAARVATGVRPGGFSSMRETSRSPKTVSSSVRGIGVADMASRCAASPLACSRVALGDAEPVLLVDHRQGQGVEGDVVLEERVGADRDRRRAAGQRRQLLGARPRPCRGRSAAPPSPRGWPAARRGSRSAGGPGSRSGPSAPTAGRPRRRRPWPAWRPPSCRSRRRPAPAGSSARRTARSARISLRVRICAPVSRKGRAASTSSASALGGDRRRRLRSCGPPCAARAPAGGRRARRRRGAAAPGRCGDEVGLGSRVRAAPSSASRHAGQRCCASQAGSCHSGSSGARASASSAKRRTPREGRPAVAG